MKKYLIMPFVLFFVITLTVAAYAEQAFVPQSGQMLCYDAAGVEIPCAGTGQDGDQLMGVPWPNPRFTDNSNGTVTDNLTGLIWLKNASCLVSSNWKNALSSANYLANGSCDLSDGSVAGDWRLPNMKELESLINRQQNNPAAWLNSVGFTGIRTGPSFYDAYWTSNIYSSVPSYVWLFYLGDGHNAIWDDSNGVVFRILPVRGGQ